MCVVIFFQLSNKRCLFRMVLNYCDGFEYMLIFVQNFKPMTKLSELKTGEEGIVVKILGHGSFRKRVIEMGFVRGHEVKVLLNAPLRDPIKYKILDYELSLRRSEADLIEVVKKGEKLPYDIDREPATVEDDDTVTVAERNSVERESNTINIALIGNPNCGKTSLFNELCNGHERVGNYSGVTVDAKDGHFDYKGFHFKVVDLPGTYSLSSYSPEERYVRKYLNDEVPDVIINVVVASNLERNLYLTTELIDMDRSMVIALNMYDEMQASGAKLDHEALAGMIGVPIVPTVSKSGQGVHELLDTVIQVFENTCKTVRHVHVNLGQEIEEAIRTLSSEVKKSNLPIVQKFASRYISIKLLENDAEILEETKDDPNIARWREIRDRAVEHIESVGNEDIVSAIASEKYGFISGALRETYTPETSSSEQKTTDIIDAIVTHKLFGFPIFLLIMWFIFWATFELGAYPMDWIDAGVGWLGDTVREMMPAGPLKDMIVDGIIGGVGGVIVFLPNIMILYFFISFMEDSGYMARAAFIMDKIMHKMGLHGKSFIPLVMGFGCNVPAVMSSRIIESRSSRLITMLIIPFMSCSARLPIYLLLVGTFFPENGSLVIFSLYVLSIVVAIITAKLMRKTMFKKDETPFVMELPPYRVPTAKASLHHMWEKGEQYLRKMGGVILVGSIIIWALSYFPRDFSKSNEDLTREELVKQQEDSYLASIGRFVEPVVEPLGFNWKGSVALISGATAKEIVVSTLGVLYASDSEAAESLPQRIAAVNPDTGHPDFTPLVALSFMVFVLLYFPCIATVVAISREAGSWKFGLFTLLYNTAVAWVVSFLVYQIGSLIL